MFTIRQCLAWRNDHRFPGMHTHRVDIFHVAHHYFIAQSVTYEFIFKFSLPDRAFLNQNLTDHAGGKSARYLLFKFSFAINQTASGASESVGTPDNKRPSDLLRKFQAFSQSFDAAAWKNRLADFFHQFSKFLAALTQIYGLDTGTQNLDIILF